MTTKTVRPLREKDREDLRFLGWTRESPWRYAHAVLGVVEYDTRRFGWFGHTPDASHGPFSTVWAAIDWMREG